MAQSFRQLAGIPDATASVKDSVLIIIDAQNEYAKGALAVDDIKTSRPAIQRLLERYRSGNGKIVHVVHDVPEGTPVFTPQTELAEEFEELQPKDGETVVHKKYPGSFAETDLDNLLKKIDAKKVVLVGYMAHVCVSTTAREAHQRGYEVVVAKDAVGDRSVPADGGKDAVSGEQLTQMVMTELGDFFATIVNSEDIQ
ncbi:isochorismatase [Cystobasidium minutum MCA 4210]|uniref:isochorismatase n=1 Tax=Cystobasidium minutum MCA 4210 TaxID=1397322 RepID=UPI0034CF8B15|eukprot:jgi/Rhomi1/194056/gm1.2270_g